MKHPPEHPTVPPARSAQRRRLPAAFQGLDPGEVLRRVRAYIGFDEDDSLLLARFAPSVEPELGRIMDDFYERIRADPHALRVISGGPAQIERLKQSLRDWLLRTLRGPHDDEFARLQAAIGRRHIVVGLEQSYMISGLNILQEHLHRILPETGSAHPERTAATRRALTKVFDLVLAIMLETYREDFIRLVQEIEESARLRRLAAIGEMAASLAHEIRNPLAGISGALQVLRDGLPEAGGRRDILAAALGEIGRLDSRVNDLLLYARPAEIRRETVDVRDLLETTVRLIAGDPHLGRVTIDVRAPTGVGFRLDPGQIRQVLVNLLLNAAQALRGTGQVRLDAVSAADGGLMVAVEDSGPGVPGEMVESIFLPFFTTRSGGTGLGLAISRRIAELHGGSLDVEAAPGGGARFILALPPVES